MSMLWTRAGDLSGFRGQAGSAKGRQRSSALQILGLAGNGQRKAYEALALKITA